MSTYDELGWASQAEYDAALAETGTTTLYKIDYDEWKAAASEPTTPEGWLAVTPSTIDTNGQPVGQSGTFTGGSVNYNTMSTPVKFTDSGGKSGNYPDNHDYYFIFDTGNDDKAWKFRINSCVTEGGFDRLKVWSAATNAMVEIPIFDPVTGLDLHATRTF